jgi:5-methylcytosine-specific restriction endonuclease McrA
VNNRLKGIEANDGNRLYCSQKCKNTCDIYGKSAEYLDRQVLIQRQIGNGHVLVGKETTNHAVKKMVMEMDGYECVRCGSKTNLNVHHEIPIKINHLLSNDVDNIIVLCESCHKQFHQNLRGCGYSELSNYTGNCE